MDSRIVEDQKSSPRREFKFSRSGRNPKAISNNVLEAIVQFSSREMAAAEGGRMKIVVRKEDLKQVLEAIRDGRGLGRRATATTTAVPLELEQRLNLLRRRQIIRAASQVKCRSRGSWRPALQSIPEEL
ncbi:hypothetical protein OROHE_015481 [Orobanche hederae]